MRKLIQGLGLFIIALALLLVIWGASGGDEALPAIVDLPAESSLSPLAPPPPTVEYLAPPQVEIVQPTATAVSPLVLDYVLNESVDLASGKPVILLLNLPGGGLLPGNWSNAVAYQATDASDIFAPDNGIIYSYKDEGLMVTWAHTGMTSSGQQLFSSNLDLFLRKGAEGIRMSLSSAQTAASKLIGQTAVLCQDETGTVRPFAYYNAREGCVGKQVILEVIAVTIVPFEMVSEYDKLSLGIWPWMMEKFPGAGFENLSAGDSWMMRFCVGRFGDQTTVGNPLWFFINRGVIAFRVIG
jgi:hypothetical protein